MLDFWLSLTFYQRVHSLTDQSLLMSSFFFRERKFLHMRKRLVASLLIVTMISICVSSTLVHEEKEEGDDNDIVEFQFPEDNELPELPSLSLCQGVKLFLHVTDPELSKTKLNEHADVGEDLKKRTQQPPLQFLSVLEEIQHLSSEGINDLHESTPINGERVSFQLESIQRIAASVLTGREKILHRLRGAIAAAAQLQNWWATEEQTTLSSLAVHLEVLEGEVSNIASAIPDHQAGVIEQHFLNWHRTAGRIESRVKGARAALLKLEGDCSDIQQAGRP